MSWALSCFLFTPQRWFATRGNRTGIDVCCCNNFVVDFVYLTIFLINIPWEHSAMLFNPQCQVVFSNARFEAATERRRVWTRFRPSTITMYTPGNKDGEKPLSGFCFWTDHEPVIRWYTLYAMHRHHRHVIFSVGISDHTVNWKGS